MNETFITREYIKISLNDLPCEDHPFKTYDKLTKLSDTHISDPNILRLFAIVMMRHNGSLISFFQTCDKLQEASQNLLNILQKEQYNTHDLETLQRLSMNLYKQKMIAKKQAERELGESGNLHTLDEARKNIKIIKEALALMHNACFLEAFTTCMMVICENGYDKDKLEAKCESLRKLLRDYYHFYETYYKDMKDRITTSVDYQTTPLYFLSDQITSALTHSFFKTKHYQKDLEKTKPVDEQLKPLKQYAELNIYEDLNFLQRLIDLQEESIDFYIDDKALYIPR